jgi:transcription antitermination factor NusB
VAAVEILYAADLRGVDAEDVITERNETDGYALKLARETSARRVEVDACIARHAEHWSVQRMSPVDRNVLRVGVLELLEADVPTAAVMDEAVELAKRFSGAEAGRFVNGVLAGVLQELSAEESSSGAGGGGVSGADGPDEGDSVRGGSTPGSRSTGSDGGGGTGDGRGSAGAGGGWAGAGGGSEGAGSGGGGGAGGGAGDGGGGTELGVGGTIIGPDVGATGWGGGGGGSAGTGVGGVGSTVIGDGARRDIR